MYRPLPLPTKKQPCPTCKGRGQVLKNDVWNWGWKPCPTCKGSGQIEYPSPKVISLPQSPQRNPLKSRP